ncbi:TPA: hypothetical protein ACG5JQ_000372 [Stenotrophomonas maltophilia]|uniref:hypothetical protein n=1 Tax=Stenotrophomonas maltophilia TaxID=40324 RepID=UPI0013DD0552|nr:hypothetical protein [Stenotrophomonas maltophilia]HDX0925482.1 hypothetical protein [Stenotrophomonas maltophilia]HDX0929152.1 hypothetical protein [Stenotrophomonas maltophilia]
MSNDNTDAAAMADQADLMLGKRTLADVQPGGRVRLGDALPPLPPEVDAVRCMIRGEGVMAEACDYYYTAEQMRDYARAALSAQPSPGGQDALATARELLAAEYDKAGEKVFADRARKGRYDNDPDVRAIVAALAARQPVGEAIGEIVYSGEGGLQIEFYDGKPLAPMKLYAAPPAQAVDLAMPIAMIDQALGHLSTALDDLDSSPDPRPGAMVTEAMACLRQALTGVPNG